MKNLIGLKGSKILFIGSGFYYYDKSIKWEIERLGALVKYFREIEISDLLKIKKLINPSFIEHAIVRRENELFDNIKSDAYDYIFVIRAQYLSSVFYEKLRIKYPKAKFLLYLWDSISTTKEYHLKSKYFDNILSFDRIDCSSDQKIIFRPLFYLKEFQNNGIISKTDSKNDIYFLGRLYGDRISVIRKIKIESDLRGLRSKLILLATFGGDLLHSLSKNSITKADFGLITFKTVSLPENIRNMISSASILDIELECQSGLTMRTIEALGSNRKIITTNKDIANYDFYDPSRVFVLDRENPSIPQDFINKPMKPFDDSILDKYSITGWIKDIFTC